MRRSSLPPPSVISIERHWQRLTPLSIALYPLSLLFRAVVALRRSTVVAWPVTTTPVSRKTSAVSGMSDQPV